MKLQNAQIIWYSYGTACLTEKSLIQIDMGATVYRSDDC